MAIAIAIAIVAYMAIGFLILILIYMYVESDDTAGLAVVLFWPFVLIVGGFIKLDNLAKVIANFLR